MPDSAKQPGRERIVEVRALLPPPPTGTNAEQHWALGRIASPMSVYPRYAESRKSFGLGALGPFVVEIETDSGVVGMGASTGGEPACWIVERHLARFLEGQAAADIDDLWDQMWRATLFYGRRGLVLHAISAVDLALWDLLGRLRGEPVHALIGGAVRDEVPLYATGPRPDAARRLGFRGAKLPLIYAPADGPEGLRRNVEMAAQARAEAGDDFMLAYDCWMALDLPYALDLARALEPYSFHWLEECFPPDEYWAYAAFRKRAAPGLLVATGEHEATRFGFRLLIDMGCCDIIQPDVTWCGGLSELLRIAAYADAHGVQVIPHVSGAYGLHFAATRPTQPFAECFMGSLDGEHPTAAFSPFLTGEPAPLHGCVRVPDRPGFGLEINRELDLTRPYTH